MFFILRVFQTLFSTPRACVRACCRAVSTNCSSALVIGVIYLDGTLCFRITSVIHMTKIGTIQRRLAWPLRKDDTHNS